MMFRETSKVSFARESCARNDVNLSPVLFTVCPSHLARLKVRVMSFLRSFPIFFRESSISNYEVTVYVLNTNWIS